MLRGCAWIEPWAWIGAWIAIVVAALTGCGTTAPAVEPTGATPSRPAHGAPVAISDELTVTSLDTGTYLVVDAIPWPANSLIVVTPTSDVILVDTPYTTDATRDELSWIDRAMGKKPIAAFNTHFHPDRLGGNAALIGAGVPVYGSDRTVDMLDERGERERARLIDELSRPGAPASPRLLAQSRAGPLLPPDHVFPSKPDFAITLGGEPVVAHFPGAAHSPDNEVIYFPRRKLLFGGCMVKSADVTGIASVDDVDLATWPAAVADVRASFPEATTVIPGHGAPGGVELLDHTKKLLEH